MNNEERRVLTHGNLAYFILAAIGIVLIVLGILPRLVLNPLFGVAVTLLAIAGFFGRRREGGSSSTAREISDR